MILEKAPSSETLDTHAELITIIVPSNRQKRKQTLTEKDWIELEWFRSPEMHFLFIWILYITNSKHDLKYNTRKMKQELFTCHQSFIVHSCLVRLSITANNPTEI